jgi:hypothetical protein
MLDHDEDQRLSFNGICSLLRKLNVPGIAISKIEDVSVDYSVSTIPPPPEIYHPILANA